MRRWGWVVAAGVVFGGAAGFAASQDERVLVAHATIDPRDRDSGQAREWPIREVVVWFGRPLYQAQVNDWPEARTFKGWGIALMLGLAAAGAVAGGVAGWFVRRLARGGERPTSRSPIAVALVVLALLVGLGGGLWLRPSPRAADASATPARSSGDLRAALEGWRYPNVSHTFARQEEAGWARVVVATEDGFEKVAAYYTNALSKIVNSGSPPECAFWGPSDSAPVPDPTNPAGRRAAEVRLFTLQLKSGGGGVVVASRAEGERYTHIILSAYLPGADGVVGR